MLTEVQQRALTERPVQKYDSKSGGDHLVSRRKSLPYFQILGRRNLIAVAVLCSDDTRDFAASLRIQPHHTLANAL